MSKPVIVGLAALTTVSLVLLFARNEFLETRSASQTFPSNLEPSGSARLGQRNEDAKRAPFIDAEANCSRLEASLQAPNKLMAARHEFSSLAAQFSLPAEVPSGVEVPWQWLDRLDSVKRAAVERAFSDSAVAHMASSSEATNPDDPKLEAAMSNLEHDITKQLSAILSSQEFEAYLLTLPDDALERLGFERIEN
jgi:hypothetical protein